MKMIIVLVMLILGNAFAASCDCQLVAYSPMTTSDKIAPEILKTYLLDNYASSSVFVQKTCINSCKSAFDQDKRSGKIRELLKAYSVRLTSSGVAGYNCTGLTTFQYPVVMRAKLGARPLGNVDRSIEVIAHEEACFF